MSRSSSSFGELVLLLGDLNIPHRTNSSSSSEVSAATVIPEKFQRMLVPGKMQHVLCTGNLGSSSHPKLLLDELLRPLAPNVHVVSGDYDPVFGASDDGKDSNVNFFPETKVIQIGAFRIGLVHGHQIVPWGDHASLAAMRRKLDVDILVHGHTLKHEVREHDDGYYYINPGSITGAWNYNCYTEGDSNPPSFILLSVQGSKVVVYSYQLLKNDEVDSSGSMERVDVSKVEFSKSDLTPRGNF